LLQRGDHHKLCQLLVHETDRAALFSAAPASASGRRHRSLLLKSWRGAQEPSNMQENGMEIGMENFKME
jgi:hypothetical protein